MTSGHSREDPCFRASTWKRQFGVFIRLHSAGDCFRKPASLHWCPKLKHPLPVDRRIKQRENIWIRVDGALDRSLLIDVCPLNINYKTCLVIKPILKNEKQTRKTGTQVFTCTQDSNEIQHFLLSFVICAKFVITIQISKQLLWRNKKKQKKQIFKHVQALICCEWDFVKIFHLKWHYSFPPTHPFFFLLKSCCDIGDIRIVVGEEGLVKLLIRLR